MMTVRLWRRESEFLLHIGKNVSLHIFKPVFEIQAGCSCGSEGTAHSPLSHSILSFFNPKTNTQFSESIVTTLVNSNEGGRDEVSNIATSARPTTQEEQEEAILLHEGGGDDTEMEDCLASTSNKHDDDDEEGSAGKSKSSATLSLSFSSSKASSSSSSTLHSNHSSDSPTRPGEGAYGNASQPPSNNNANVDGRLFVLDNDDGFNSL